MPDLIFQKKSKAERLEGIAYFRDTAQDHALLRAGIQSIDRLVSALSNIVGNFRVWLRVKSKIAAIVGMNCE